MIIYICLESNSKKGMLKLDRKLATLTPVITIVPNWILT